MTPSPQRATSARMHSDCVAAAAEGLQWLLASGIQCRKGIDAGGFFAWFDEEKASYPYLYAEITGYLMTLLAGAGRREALASARRAGDWLLRRMRTPTGGFRCVDRAGGTRFAKKTHLVYAFDNGVIVHGLCHLHTATGDARYLEAAREAAGWLVHDAHLPGGGFRPVFDAVANRWQGYDDEWSMQPGPYLAKAAAGLLHLFERTGDERLRDLAVETCTWSLDQQESSGRFLTCATNQSTNAHPHCYAAEGLFVVGATLGIEEFLTASARATDWLLDRANPAGRIPRLYGSDGIVYHERVDVIAQTLRLAVLHLHAGRLSPRRRPSIHGLAAALLDRRRSSPDARASGGVPFGSLSSGTEKLHHRNAWVTAFSVQAWQLYAQFLENRVRFRPLALV